MAILYVETNFVMGIAVGRDPDARTLLADLPPTLRLAIPSICCVEAYSAYKAERKRVDTFVGLSKHEMSQLDRNRTSKNAVSLRDLLSRAVESYVDLSDEMDNLVWGSLERLATEAEWIEMNGDLLRRSWASTLIDDAPTDNLILHCVFDHAARNPDNPKAFLTHNSRDFGTAEVRAALRGAGVEKSFTQVADVLGWLGSLPDASAERSR